LSTSEFEHVEVRLNESPKVIITWFILLEKNILMQLINFIRKEKKFKNINQLKKQINLDLKIAKKKLK